MRKSLSLLVLLTFFAAGSLFAWEPMDLTRYPKCTTPGDFTVNLGVGLPYGFIVFPPVRVSGDFNVPVGDKKLPFFGGFLVTYSGQSDEYIYAREWENGVWVEKKKVWYVSNITVGGRFGYHFNWAVDNLDTYAVTTAGFTVYAADKENKRHAPHIGENKFGEFFWGINLGARWWVSQGFGFWAETGYNPFSWIDIGLAFKF